MYHAYMKKVVIITGASSGIGLATANYLTSKGFKVYGISRREFFTPNFVYLKGDVTDYQNMSQIFEEIYKKEGHIDALINNAGMGISGAVEYLKADEVEKIFSVNVKSVIMLSSLILPYLRLSKGKIVNISSVASPIAIPFQSCYSATKSAIEAFSLALQNEIKSQGIKVCCVRPGDTKTNFTSSRIKTDVENDIYGKRITKSVNKMEKDEQNGKSPITVSKVIFKVLKRKNPPLLVTVGFGYKFLCLLAKFLPTRLVNFIVGKLY